MNTIRTALIGAGWVAEHAYLPALQQQIPIRVTRVYDVDNTRARRLADRLSYAAAANGLAECFDDDIDAVLICTPTPFHVALIVQALSAGKFVLCEKPVARDGCELQKIESVAGHSEHLMGGVSTRLRDDVSSLMRWLKGGRIGPLSDIELEWSRAAGVPAPASWRTDAQFAPTGVLEDLGPHLLDIAAVVVPVEDAIVRTAILECRHGHDPRAAEWFAEGAAGTYVCPDFASATITAAGCVNVKFKVCWTNEDTGDLCRVRFVGASGKAELITLFGFSRYPRVSEATCTLVPSHAPIEVVRFPIGPEKQVQAFKTLLIRFAELCIGRLSAAEEFATVRRVALWLGAIREAAEAKQHMNWQR